MYRKIILLIMLSLSIGLTGCFNGDSSKDMSASTDENIDFKPPVYEYTTNEKLSNIIKNKLEIGVDTTGEIQDQLVDVNLRDELIVNHLKGNLVKIKAFCKKNNINLGYYNTIAEQHKGSDSEQAATIKKLEVIDSEDHYGENDNMSIEMATGLMQATKKNGKSTYTIAPARYRCTIKNINADFNFKDSALNSFRNDITDNDTSIDFDIVDKFIKDYFSWKLDSDIIFFNKIEEGKYESISIENNNISYRLTYSPIR